jgi:hypothetical protein
MMSDMVRHFQTNEEAIAAKGTVVQDGTWKNTLIIRRLSWTADMDHEEIPLVGQEDPHSDESLFMNGTLNIEGYFWDTRFIRYCTELGVGTGTIAATNSALFSYKQAGVNATRLFYGMICDSAEITIGKIHTFSGQFKVMDISPLLTDAELDAILETTSWTPAPVITSRPLTHRDMSVGGATPFSYGGTPRDIMGATIRVTRNAYIKDPLGSIKGTTAKHANRRTEVTLDFWHEDDVPFEDVIANTQRNLVFTLKTGTPNKLITITNWKPFTKPQDIDAGSTDPIMDTCTGAASGITVDDLVIAQ